MKRALISSIVATAVAILLAPAAASADEAHGFSNSTQIDIPTQGSASPYPSTIHVDGLKGPVVDVEVGLIGVTHTRPNDLDVLLVAPDGRGVVLMSDACGADPVSNYTWVFKSTGGWPQMSSTCPGVFYSATNISAEPDSWPDSQAPFRVPLTYLHQKAMNGDWKLYVVDDSASASGKIARGWTLQLTTASVDNLVPGSGTFGPAQKYPATRTVDGPADRVIRDVNVVLSQVEHDRPSDLSVLLVGPQRQSVMLMQGACAKGTLAPYPYLIFDDQAAAPLPEDASRDACGGRATPTDYQPGTSVPAPAPSAPYGTSLGAFDGTSPNGEWKLYAFDGVSGADGYIAKPFALEVTTRPKAIAEFARSAITVPEGGAQTVTITRSADGALGPADVAITTTTDSASAGADFTPISQTVHFDRGDAEKTVTLDAIDDGVAEPDETYAVKLSDPTGDARLGTQTQVAVTIPASAGKSKADLPPPPPAPRCDGKPATIVGTAGKDVLRGTRRADVIAGLGGSDTITAVKGNDMVCGGPGSDTIAGGAGRDRLLGGPGNDRLTGGAGRDTCLGGRGRNRVTCERKTGA